MLRICIISTFRRRRNSGSTKRASCSSAPNFLTVSTIRNSDCPPLPWESEARERLPPRNVPTGKFNSRCVWRFKRLLLRHSKPVDLHLEKMIDADAVDTVSFRHRSALGFGVHYCAVNHEVDLVRADAHFERVGGFSAGV